MLLSERMSAWEKVEVMYFFLGIQGLAMVLAVATALALRAFQKKEAQDIFLIAFLLPMLTLGYILHARYLGGASQMRLNSPFVFIALALLLGWGAKMRFALIGMLFGKPLRLLAAVGLIATLLAMTGPSANTGLQRLLGISINVNRG
ncbi:MAG: hypothetical protein EBZ67_02270 [Chitinophagia bacterium]|nr:hypothetical protein [Chitinophagia bacterium]